ncbi:unnamed protein product [Spirodela intermedia]|uniref:Uncharacterized protein n=1 Tax=Spirodela intermedia TaxID=51605 RepID=A0A7I8IRG9_SPIIN|nr:unnamed protein product [Spirodela intermedia]CAA6659551.1 unnamed protein product [Spirodela intermedia]
MDGNKIGTSCSRTSSSPCGVPPSTFLSPPIRDIAAAASLFLFLLLLRRSPPACLWLSSALRNCRSSEGAAWKNRATRRDGLVVSSGRDLPLRVSSAWEDLIQGPGEPCQSCSS